MIRRTEFYKEEDRITRVQKSRIWQAVHFQLFSGDLKSHFNFEWRNYTLGMATSVILFLAGIGVWTLIGDSRINAESELSLLNSTYSQAIYKLEKIAARKLSNSNVKNLDELLQAKSERLNSVSNAISEIKTNKELREFETIKEKRLRQLYLMKLEILDEIIAMEGG